jgi:hypothetical protein
MCDVLLPPSVNPIAVKYIYHLLYSAGNESVLWWRRTLGLLAILRLKTTEFISGLYSKSVKSTRHCIKYWDGVVGIATWQGLHDTVFVHRRRRDFPHTFRPALEPACIWVSGVCLGLKLTGCDVDQQHSLTSKLRKEYSYTDNPLLCRYSISRGDFTCYSD